MHIITPQHPLAAHAFVVPSSSSSPFRVIRTLTAKFSSFLAVSRWQPGNTAFDWQVVPFQKAGGTLQRIAAQLTVLFRFVVFGVDYKGTLLGANYAGKEVTLEVFPIEDPHESLRERLNGDAFCQAGVINAQLIEERTHVNLLTTHAPLTARHFLVVPKQHRAGFPDLYSDEYQEVMEVALHVLNKYGKEAYLYHKTGRDAGQTVPHWHLHIVILNSNGEGLIAKLKSFVKTLLPFLNFPISKSELSALVSKIKEELQ